MGFAYVAFDEMEWVSGGHPLERKKPGDAGLSLLRFEPGFSDPHWCGRSHVLFVTQGTLSIELEDREVLLRAGQALWLEPGTRHRAAVKGPEAVVVLAASDLRRTGA
jgi:quercetin dioxygenase-like cupin family protein